MAELVNLPTGAILSDAPSSANDPPGTTAKTDASPGAGSFQAVIAGLMNAIPGVDETVESWAGQQVTENAKPGEKESGETPDQPTADLLNLLGSLLQTPLIDVAAQAAIVTPAASPSDAPVEQATVQAGAVADVAALVKESGVVSPAAVPAQSEPASGEVPEASPMPQVEVKPLPGVESPRVSEPAEMPKLEVFAGEEATAQALPTAAILAESRSTSLQPQAEATSAPVAETSRIHHGSDSRKGIIPRAEAPSFAESQPEKPNADRPLGLDPATTQSAPHDSSDGADRSVKPAEAIRGSVSGESATITQTSDVLTQSPVAVKPSTSVEQMIRDLLPTLEKTSAVGQTSQDAQLDTAKREQGDTSTALAEPRPSFERSLAGAAKSNGYQAPERVMEQKVMEQVVRAAKIHLVDGGASMNLRLDPPHLGTVQMTVSAQQGVVTAHLQTSTETAKQVLEADLALLRQALSDAGIAVDSINVSISSGGGYDRLLHGNSQGGRSDQGTRANTGFFGRYVEEDAETEHTNDRTGTVGGLDYLA